MTAAEIEQSHRRVRPWIAALLTFLGWGVGFYYARTKGAWTWAVIQIVFSIALGVGLILFALFVDQRIIGVVSPEGGPPLLLEILINLPVAILAWIATAKHERVERGSPARLFGYLAIWLVPLVCGLALAMGLRFTTLQPFRMPSGSMQPTLDVGDYILVAKWSYGYGRYSTAPINGLFPAGRLFPHQPQRGDIVVFRPRPDPERDFVKRVVGLPGDRIQMIDGQLTINGQTVAREDLGVRPFVDEDGFSQQIQEYRETLPNGVSYVVFDRTPRGELDNTEVFVVPPGNYFTLGDDRDNSADSRVPSVVGYVPFDNLVGRVDHILNGPHHPRS